MRAQSVIPVWIESAAGLTMIWRLRAEREGRLFGERLAAIELRAQKLQTRC